MTTDRIEREIQYFRHLVAGYTDAIRASDFKANIALLFVPMVVPEVLSARDTYPSWLPLPVVLAPFLAVYFFLILCLVPRYPSQGKQHFPVARDTSPEQFIFDDDPNDILVELRLRAALLSRILFRKTLCLRISFYVSLAVIVAVAVLLARFGFVHAP